MSNSRIPLTAIFFLPKWGVKGYSRETQSLSLCNSINHLQTLKQEEPMKNFSMMIILLVIALLLIGTDYSWSKKSSSKADRTESWFNEIDANGDGKISKDEHKKHAEKRAEDRFMQMDVNKDGFLSKEEFKEGMPKKKKKGKQKGKQKAKE
jgi:hypothetical protein